jgi:hypothetical protein
VLGCAGVYCGVGTVITRGKERTVKQSCASTATSACFLTQQQLAAAVRRAVAQCTAPSYAFRSFVTGRRTIRRVQLIGPPPTLPLR